MSRAAATCWSPWRAAAAAAAVMGVGLTAMEDSTLRRPILDACRLWGTKIYHTRRSDLPLLAPLLN